MIELRCRSRTLRQKQRRIKGLVVKIFLPIETTSRRNVFFAELLKAVNPQQNVQLWIFFPEFQKLSVVIGCCRIALVNLLYNEGFRAKQVLGVVIDNRIGCSEKLLHVSGIILRIEFSVYGSRLG